MDLDGMVSYLLLKWTFPKDIVECQPTTVGKFRVNFTKWLSTHNLEDYDKVFILDLAVFEDKDLIDYKNVFIIDHHPGHEAATYKNALSIIKPNYGSAAKLAYKVLKSLYNLNPTKKQLHLVVLADDFDSYKLELPDSFKLDVVFWGMNDKLESFTKSFINGFNGFTMQQENIIKLQNLKLAKYKESIVVYAGDVDIQGKTRRVCSTFAKEYINQVADILLKDYMADVALVINTNTMHVSYRRQKDGDVDLALLAREIADGYGHVYSSGSGVTDNFVEFTKQLIKI